MKKFNLTKKQLELFNFIKKYIDENNMAPSYEEMKVGTEVSSKSLIFVKSICNIIGKIIAQIRMAITRLIL